jgi:hypothetical protein
MAIKNVKGKNVVKVTNKRRSTDGFIHISASVNKVAYKKFKELCYKNNVTPNGVIASFVQEWVKENEKE